MLIYHALTVEFMLSLRNTGIKVVSLKD